MLTLPKDELLACWTQANPDGLETQGTPFSFPKIGDEWPEFGGTFGGFISTSVGQADKIRIYKVLPINPYANTGNIRNVYSQPEAINFVTQLNKTDGFGDWYIPSTDQLRALHYANTNRSQFPSGFLRTSTRRSSDTSRVYSVRDDAVDSMYDHHRLHVVMIREASL